MAFWEGKGFVFILGFKVFNCFILISRVIFLERKSNPPLHILLIKIKRKIEVNSPHTPSGGDYINVGIVLRKTDLFVEMIMITIIIINTVVKTNHEETQVRQNC